MCEIMFRLFLRLLTTELLVSNTFSSCCFFRYFCFSLFFSPKLFRLCATHLRTFFLVLQLLFASTTVGKLQQMLMAFLIPFRSESGVKPTVGFKVLFFCILFASKVSTLNRRNFFCHLDKCINLFAIDLLYQMNESWVIPMKMR